MHKGLSHTQNVVCFVVHINNRTDVCGFTIPIRECTESIGSAHTVICRQTEKAAFEIQIQIVGDSSATVDFCDREGTTTETGSLAQGWEDKQAE